MIEQELFVEYPPLGKADAIPSYYRIRVEAAGSNGKVDYRAGWYDAQAVDALFGDIGKQAGAEAATGVRRRQAIDRLFDAYMSALESGQSADIVLAAKVRYQEVLGTVTGVTTAGDTPASSLDHANEKFIMVFANDPDRIIEAIKNTIQQSKITGALENAFDLRNRSQGEKARLQFKLLAGRLSGLVAQLDAAQAAVDPNARVDELLRVVGTITAALEAQR